MSEKRFELTKINPTVNPFDTVYLIIDYENPNKEIRTLKDCVDLLNEQESTIRRLQDLCGESDGENAKLRIENKRLQAENKQLKQELAELLAVHTKIVETLDSEFVSKALEDGD